MVCVVVVMVDDLEVLVVSENDVFVVDCWMV